MKRIAIDIETHLIKPGQLFPKVVCISFYDGVTRDLMLACLGIDRVLQLLANPAVILIGHNIAYDLGCIVAEAVDQGHDPHAVLSLVFQAYADDRIVDTMVRTMLIDIACGDFQEVDGQRRGKHYSLDVLAHRWLKRFMKKLDTWRLHYAALDGVPLADWPPEAKEYAETDAEVTWLCDAAITAWCVSEGLPDGDIPDQFRQTRSAWVLHLMAGWGLCIDASLVATVRENLEAQRTASYAIMEQYGLFKKDRFGQYKRTAKGQICKDQKRLKALIEEGFATQGETPPTTAGRVNKATGIRTPETACGADEARASGHIACIAYADVANADKLLSTYVPALERASITGIPLTSSPNVLVASGRTSWSKPNLQNSPQVGNIRECMIPRSPNYEVVEVTDSYILGSGESWV